jgi:hypothetical protein
MCLYMIFRDRVISEWSRKAVLNFEYILEVLHVHVKLTQS